jgi:protein-L-isoaspartate(D-aspartate) O-methyltransferase
LESDETLVEAAMAAGVDTALGELANGWTKGDLFDLILLDGAVEEIPSAFGKQLAPEGRLAGAIMDRGITRLIIGTCANGAIGWRSVADADVAALPGFERPRAFTF